MAIPMLTKKDFAFGVVGNLHAHSREIRVASSTQGTNVLFMWKSIA
jgi:hypothetical protein